jgi:hypothetical protein
MDNALPLDSRSALFCVLCFVDYGLCPLILELDYVGFTSVNRHSLLLIQAVPS